MLQKNFFLSKGMFFFNKNKNSRQMYEKNEVRSFRN